LQKAFIYLSLTLLLVGIIIFIAGLYFILVEGIRVYYKDLNLVVPVYEVSTKWPGNYSEVVDIPLVMLEVAGRPFSEPFISGSASNTSKYLPENPPKNHLLVS